MPILLNLSSLAVRQVLEGVYRALDLAVGERALDRVVKFLGDRFTDQSQRLPQALHKANASAWKALEIALAGESLWTWLDKAEHKAFREQVRAFLDATPLAGLPAHGAEFRSLCLRQLRAARKADVLTGGTLHPAELAQAAGAFARFSDPQSLLNAEWQAVDGMALELRGAGYEAVGHLVALRPDGAGGVSVLVAAVRYFFRREVETDRELYQGLTWAKLEALQEASDHAFAALAQALAGHAERVEEMLSGLHETLAQTHGAVLDMQAEQQRQGQQMQEMYQAVLDMKRRHDLQASELRPRDSLAIGSESERRLVKAFMERFRALPREQQERLPALLNSLAQLEVAAGDFDAAQHDFQQVASLVSDRAARAEAHHNAYGAALEKGDCPAALAALMQAAALDPARFAPFPPKYEPERILGAGGFGVAFLCRNRHVGNRVVVKALRTDSLERQVTDVFREARVLEELEHPAIIRLRDCDFADAEGKRPYLVMDYFDGPTLAEQVEKHGPLVPEQVLALARPVAEALQAAHACGILHRDVKPANLLVRQDGGGWRVKLIDFGLALKQSVLTNTAAGTAGRVRTVTGYSIGGTLDYAAPEQMGRLPGVTVGPCTDVYGFGKTCCYALFKTANPLRKHWSQIPDALADLLEHCLQEQPAERLAGFDAVLAGLAKLSDRPAVPVTVVKPAPPPVQAEPVESNQQGFWGSLKNQLFAEAASSAEPSRARWWASPAAGEVVRFEGHNDGVLAVAFAPDGREVLSGGADGTVRLWETQTGRELACMLGHRDKIEAVAFLPDGKRALSAGKDRSVRLWNLESGREIRSLEGRTNRSVAVSPDGKYAITGSITDGMVRLWEAETGREKLRLKGHMGWVLAAAFAPSGKLMALTASADGTARLWELESGRELRRLQGHKDQVLSVAFCPTGQRALTSSADGSVRLWDLRSGKELRVWEGVAEQAWSVAFAPDGRHAFWENAASSARGAECALVMWDVQANREAHRFSGHTARIQAVAVSPDGRCALTGSMDKTMRLWQLPE